MNEDGKNRDNENASASYTGTSSSRNTDKTIVTRPFSVKRWGGVFILGALALALIFGLTQKDLITRWKAEWELKKQEREHEKLLKADTHGGSTPEETFDMFIAALESGDTDLASKYFVIEKQERWKKTLDEYKGLDFLDDLVKELKIEKNNWLKSENSSDVLVQFNYDVHFDKDYQTNFNGQEVIITKGNYQNAIIFEKYPGGNWKIRVF